MKQQFLNDSGLTELIGYIKKYVKDEQDVKPYASLSVFPKTGEQNIIYIDTTVNASYYWDDTSNTYKALDVQTWATLNGKPSTFPPEDHNHDDRYFTETEMNSKLAGKANSSHKHKKADITDFPTSMPASDVPAWAKASTKPTYTKAEVGLGNVDNTADKDKSVKYATSAGSAGTASSVDWSGVKNPPTTYAPSAHTHDDRYYTESEINSKLDGKSNTGHTHDDRYYTESEMNTKLAGKSDTSHSHNLSTMINTLTECTSAPMDDDYYIAQYAGGGTTTTTYHRRLHSALWSYIKGKADFVYQVKGSYAASSHTHTIAQISNLQTILDSKASASHTHTIAQVSGLQSALDGKAASVHSHSYAGSASAGGAANSANAINLVAGNEIRFTKPSFTSPQALHFGWAWADNSKTKLISEYRFDGGDGQLTQVTASQFNGNVNGNANTATALTSSAGSATQPVYFSGGKPVACSYTINASVPSGAKFTDTNTWRPLGTTADTACAGNDSRLSNARPASDVYSWAKASSKPSYSWGEISGKPSTFTPSSHTHNYAGSSSAGGSANWANGASYANYAIKTACNPTEDKSTNGLFMFQHNENTTICPDSAWWSVVRTQHSGYNNGYWQEMAYRFDSDIIKFRRNVNGSKSAWKTIAFTDSKVSSAGYADSAGSAGSVAWGNVSGRPSSMPASDVYSWAKASSKPSYSWSEITGKPGSFTPSAHTHTIANITNLQSTLDSKALNSNTIKGVSANGYWGLATPASNSVDWIRTTSNGLLPSQPGVARSGHSALGTSSWYFSSAYIDNVNVAASVKIGQPNNSNNGAIELYGASPYIDFHTSGTNTDYSSRIIAYSDRIEFVFA